MQLSTVKFDSKFSSGEHFEIVKNLLKLLKFLLKRLVS